MTFLRWLFSAKRNLHDAVAHAAVWGLIAFVAMVACAFFTGITFGQQCAAAGFEHESVQWHSCVERLGKGGRADV